MEKPIEQHPSGVEKISFPEVFQNNLVFVIQVDALMERMLVQSTDL